MNPDELKSALESAVPGCKLEIVQNPSPSAQHSLLIDHEHAIAIALYLRDTAKLDYCSNVTGIDWPAKETTTKSKVKKLVDGVETEVEETQTTRSGDYLESVYHLFSMELKNTNPVILRMRTTDRAANVTMPSLTPIWRSAEFQEREIYDLYGIVFDGHPDLRRILMWDEFTDYPMRRDYVEPDDYEYEPTAHDEVLKRAQDHRSATA